MALQGLAGSCGIFELHSIHNWTTVDWERKQWPWEKVIAPVSETALAYCIFSDHEKLVTESDETAAMNTGSQHVGRQLAAFIRENNLGTLIESEPRFNPNSNNMIRVWVWGVDREATRKIVNVWRAAEAEEKKKKLEAKKKALEDRIGAKPMTMGAFIQKMKLAPKSIRR